MVQSRDDKIAEKVAYIVMILVGIIVIVPFVILFVSSITNETVLLKEGYSLIPKRLSMQAYSYIWKSKNTILRAYFTTIVITFIGTTINVLITTMIAYPLSLSYLPGRKILSFVVLFTMLFSGGLVPTYMNYTTILGIKNTYLALLLPNLMFSAVNCIIVRTYFQGNIPVELYESAQIDGASEFRIFGSIVIPLGKPILVTIAIFAGLGYWNDWMNGLYYVTDQRMYTIQQLLNVMIQNIQYLTQYGQSGGENLPSISLRMAIAFVAMLPIIVLYPFLQKYFEAGITFGAVKG
ncbi:MAG: carbohydrate ABC transporter permease [Lachnospiraceae bacterium]|jgi:putative aldouronate transport system permease protein|nr:carbohydrate ABC transporter permease [Lachnospiraceae bacterium]